MGRQIGCDVDWQIAPEGTVFYSEGYFRNEKGDWWSEVWGRWCSTQYTVEELTQANDYEPKPEETKMEDTVWARSLDKCDVRVVDWTTAPEGAQFFSDRYFRKHKKLVGEFNRDNDLFEYKWGGGGGSEWELTIEETLEEHEDYIDFEMNPNLSYDQSLDNKWDSGKLGRDEEFVKVSEEQETLNTLLEEATRIAANGGTFVKVVPLEAPKTSIQFLDEVKYIQSERAAEYEQEGGERSFAKIATVFNTYTGKDLQPSDIALILEILKNVRFYSQDGYHRDSVVDKISYGSLWAELVTEERE